MAELTQNELQELLNGIYKGDLEHIEDDSLVQEFKESFDAVSDTLKLEQNDAWSSLALSDHNFRKVLLKGVLYNIDHLRTGADFTTEVLSEYDSIIDNTFEEHSVGGQTTAHQRQNFLLNYVEYVKGPLDFDNNRLDMDYLRAEVTDELSEELFFEEQFMHKEDYKRLLDARRQHELETWEDMRSNEFSDELTKDIRQELSVGSVGSVEDYTVSRLDAYFFDDTRDRAYEVYSYLSEHDVRSLDFQKTLSNKELLAVNHPELLGMVEVYNDSIEQDVQLSNNIFRINANEFISERSMQELNDLEYTIPTWNGLVLGDGLSESGSTNSAGPLYAAPLPNKESPVTIEMLSGTIVNQVAESLQSTHEQLRDVSTVHDFINKQIELEDIYDRELSPSELSQATVPFELDVSYITYDAMQDSLGHALDIRDAQGRVLDQEMDIYYADDLLDDYDRRMLFGQPSAIFQTYDSGTWEGSTVGRPKIQERHRFSFESDFNLDNTEKSEQELFEESYDENSAPLDGIDDSDDTIDYEFDL